MGRVEREGQVGLLGLLGLCPAGLTHRDSCARAVAVVGRVRGKGWAGRVNWTRTMAVSRSPRAATWALKSL